MNGNESMDGSAETQGGDSVAPEVEPVPEVMEGDPSKQEERGSEDQPLDSSAQRDSEESSVEPGSCTTKSRSQEDVRGEANDAGPKASSVLLQERGISEAQEASSTPQVLPQQDAPDRGVNTDIEPLPLARGQNSSWVQPLPGAYSVQGMNDSHQTNPTTTVEADMTTPDSGLGVVEGAVLVDEENPEVPVRHSEMQEPHELIEGRIMEDRTQPRRHLGWAVLLGLLVCGLVVVLIPLLLPKDNGMATDETTVGGGGVGNASSPNDTKVYPPFQDGLARAVSKAIEEDVSSPYFKANIWMWQDPYRDSYTAERQRQRFQMVALYHFTQGENWTRNDHWLSYETSECEWFSSSVVEPACNEVNVLDTLNLSHNNLNGDISNLQDFDIEDLRIIDVEDNDLFGAPAALGGNKGLEVFILSNNRLESHTRGSGSWESFGLRVIKTDRNNFIGGSSSGLFFYLVPDLQVFNNSGNSFVGPLGREMGTCKNLTHYSSKCDHVGTIPSEIGKLTKLQEFDIEGNLRMTGTIPSESGLLTRLTSLDISGTSITGLIPQQLCDSALRGDLRIRANCSLVECCSAAAD